MKQNKKHRYFFLLFFILFLLYAKPVINLAESNYESIKIEDSIRLYLNSVIKAYRYNQPNYIRTYTTQTEFARITNDIMATKKTKRILISRLKHLTVNPVATNFQNGINKTAITTEKWTYYYIDAKTRKPMTTVTNVVYEVDYTLVRRGDLWLIDHTWVERQKLN